MHQPNLWPASLLRNLPREQEWYYCWRKEIVRDVVLRTLKGRFSVNGKNYVIELHYFLYAADIIYNLIYCRNARCYCPKTSIEDSEKTPSKGLMGLIGKRSGKAMAVRAGTQEGPYDAFVAPIAAESCDVTCSQTMDLWLNCFGHASKDFMRATVSYTKGVKLGNLPDHCAAVAHVV